MVRAKRKWYPIITTTKYEADFGFPSRENSLKSALAQSSSDYPLRLLGTTTPDGEEVTMSEEQRPHIHIIGSTQMGKSKYIEHLVRGDVLRGNGALVVDPSAGARTMHAILRWCCYNGFEKVLLIDHTARFTRDRLPRLSPFLYTADGGKSEKLEGISAADFSEVVRILFDTADPTHTPRINRYLPQISRALYRAKRGLPYLSYFMKVEGTGNGRREIYEAGGYTPPDIEEVFEDKFQYQSFQSTINRLVNLTSGTLGMMFAFPQGVDFLRLITDGWVILVNCDPTMGMGLLETRLLGLFSVTQTRTAVERIIARNLEKTGKFIPWRYYAYIDEAGRFANESLATYLAEKQATGLRLTLAHQYGTQFKREIWDSILANTKVTVQFDTRNYFDRHQLSQMFYGGDISVADAEYANANLPRQYAV